MGKIQDGKKHFPGLHGEKERTEAEKKLLLRRKRFLAIISFMVLLGLFGLMTYQITKALSLSSKDGIAVEALAENFRELINSYGSMGILIAFGIQMLQVIFPIIPGEVVEVGMGLCYGPVGGSVICLIGVALASVIVLLFVKKLGIKAVELFVSVDRINEFRFINNEKKLERLVFLLYLIPGTPKDALTFFFGLTRISISDFIFITTIARIPSVVSSTIGGTFLVDQNYLGAILIFAVTGAFAVIGLFVYKAVLGKLRTRREKKSELIKENNHKKEHR